MEELVEGQLSRRGRRVEKGERMLWTRKKYLTPAMEIEAQIGGEGEFSTVQKSQEDSIESEETLD